MISPGQCIIQSADARSHADHPVGEQSCIRRPNGTGNLGDVLWRGPTHGGLKLVLSVRQPWAWLIVKALKNIENRTWATGYRGPFFVHAAQARSQSLAWEEWEACLRFVAGFAPDLVAQIPSPDRLPYGGIVGESTVLTCVSHSQSPWFVGPKGFALADSRELPFRPCRGSLGFFALPD